MVCSNYEQYENIGNNLLDFLRYNNELVDHFELIPEPLREDFKLQYQSLQTELEGLNPTETLTYFEGEGLIGAQYYQSIQELIDFINTSTLNSPLDFVNKSTEIVSMIESKKNDLSINCMEKKSIISFYSMMRGLLDYFGEVAILNESLDSNQVSIRDCSFLENVKCYYTEVVKHSLIGAAIGWGLFKGYHSEIWGLPASVAGATIGAVVGGAIGVLEGINSIQQGPGGPCCPAEWDCATVLGINLAFAADCSAGATYTAYGAGIDVASLNWANGGGMPTTINTLVAFPSLFITQDNPSVPVTTTITSVCSDPATTLTPSSPFVRNLADLSKSVKGVQLVGPDQVYVGPGPTETYMYTVFGLTAYLGSNFSPNLSVDWFINGGTITGSNATSAVVQWNASLTSGWIQAQVKNNCPGGESKVFTINVTGGGPIP